MAQILVVDDSSTVRNEVGDFLVKSGLTVALAVDGRDGLVKLKADPAIKLIVCDVNMPNMDGLTANSTTARSTLSCSPQKTPL
jgi:two-component system chemotaxis response regulator CheY